MYKQGDKILIKNMENEPRYTGKIGIITHIDDIGQLHGTWGGLALNPKVDEIQKIEENTIVETKQ